MTAPQNGTLAYRMDRAETEIEKLKEVKPEVMAEQIRNLSAEVQNLRHAFYAMMVTIAAGVIVFMLTVR